MITLSQKGIDLIKYYEKCSLKAYLCPAKRWTIGWGNTFYEGNVPVKDGDKITQERADALFTMIVNDFVKSVDAMVHSNITENQFAALVSFAYNTGIGNIKSSTLLKMVNSNPNEPLIRNEFMKWVRANGKVLKGLQKRRAAEADLYFAN